ncbi:GGDEF domain-containing protein [Aureimonas ureilytica]|uniref:GGDEF domain-containing protein n=1 Tax=Aureimonas ureilytica TaxID=401562 RepID=UPI0003753F7F|nr:GGDEF domain-containing protein [Aureimonas ureilytica]
MTQIGWAMVIATTGNFLFLLFMPIDLALWVGRRRLRHRIVLPRSAEIETAGATLALLNVGWSVLVATQVILLLQAGNLRALVLGMMLSVGERSYTSTLYAGFPRLTRACAAISTLAQMIGLWLAFNPQLVPMVPMAVALSLAFLLLGRRAHATLLEAVKARQIAHRQSRLDPLTGLGNRLAKLERLEAICEAAGAGERFGSLLYIDLDGFKLVNDRFGHAVGDRVLVEVGRRLSACLRKHDIACRTGGDEFAVLVTAMDEFSLRHLASTIVSSVQEPIAITEQTSVNVGASVGIATTSPETTSPACLMETADAALYDAKRSGKGRFVIAS